MEVRASVPPPKKRDYDLVDLAAMLEPDGGMPGSKPEIRAARTAAAIFAFLAEGHTAKTGAFRGHVARLLAFLKSQHPASREERQLLEQVIEAAKADKAPRGNWLAFAMESDTNWKQVEPALHKSGIVS